MDVACCKYLFANSVKAFKYGYMCIFVCLCRRYSRCNAACSGEIAAYHALRQNQLTATDAAELLPERSTLAMVWRYLAAVPGQICEAPMWLCRKIVRWSDAPLSLGQLMTCLDIFADVGLLKYTRQHKYLNITITAGNQKADLNTSATMQTLQRMKES